MKERIELGWKVRDTITGIEGVAVQRLEYLHDSTSIAVEREGTDRDGRRHDLAWFTEARLQKVT